MRIESFPTFASHWTPIAASTALKRAKPLAEVFDGIPVVLFRDGAGVAQALVDRCPHRSVKLSIGTVRADGAIQCAFHGWTFGGDGRARSIPLNPNVNVAAVCAQPVAALERGGLIWLNGAANAKPASALTTPQTLDAPGWFGAIVVRDWDCHWSRAIQTMLDVGHIPFVHPRSIGAAFGRALGKGGEVELAQEVKDTGGGGYRLTWNLVNLDATDAGDSGWVAFHAPNGLSLGIPQKRVKRQSMLHVWCSPLTPTTSRMVVVSRRNFGRYAILPRLYDLLTPLILGENRRNMTTVWPSEVPATGEVSMPSDAATIAFQKYYRTAFCEQETPQ